MTTNSVSGPQSMMENLVFTLALCFFARCKTRALEGATCKRYQGSSFKRRPSISFFSISFGPNLSVVFNVQSVVVLSDHVFVNLYSWVAQHVGKAYFADGIMGLAAGIGLLLFPLHVH